MPTLEKNIEALNAALEEADIAQVRTILIQQLQESWSTESAQALNETLEALAGSDINEETIGRLVGRMESRLGERFARQRARLVSQTMEVSHLLGKATVAQDADPSFTLRFGGPDERAIRALEENSTFWIGSHYDRQVQDRIRSTAEDLLEEGAGAFRTGQRFREAFGQDLEKSQSYWDLLGTVTTTRSRSFGQIQSLVEAGATAGEIDAVIDRRTSEICRTMDGAVIPIDRLAGHRDTLLNDTETPEDWKEVAPWPTAEQAEMWTQEQFIENGVMIPPLHGHCRSGIVIARQ